MCVVLRQTFPAEIPLVSYYAQTRSVERGAAQLQSSSRTTLREERLEGEELSDTTYRGPKSCSLSDREIVQCRTRRIRGKKAPCAEQTDMAGDGVKC